MNTTALRTTTRRLSKVVNKNSPTVLTALGVAGLVGTAISAAYATKPMLAAIEAEEQFRFEEESDPRPLTTEEKILIGYKFYIPTFLLGLTTAGCIIGANSIHTRRNAALASLLAVADTSLREYQSKVVETLGEKKAAKIEEELAQDRLDKNPPRQEIIFVTGRGNYLCYEERSDRYFRSTREIIDRAVNAFNQKLIREGWLGINEFYSELGIGAVELGDEFGWIAERGLLELKTWYKGAKLEDGSSEPCMVIGYVDNPHHI